jgi:hypothetical protein
MIQTACNMSPALQRSRMASSSSRGWVGSAAYAPDLVHDSLLQLFKQYLIIEHQFSSDEAGQVVDELDQHLRSKAHEGTNTQIAFVDPTGSDQHAISSYVFDMLLRSMTIGAGTTLDISYDFGALVNFAANTGTLKIENSSTFAGTVVGMIGQDTIDFADIDFTNLQQLSYHSADASGGMLTVSDGLHIANVALIGNYLASTFVPSSDGHGGTNVIDPPLTTVAQAVTLTPTHA